MGRRQYLQRLALGRSAFQDTAEDVPSVLTRTAQQIDGESGNGRAQQYDVKGRPVDPKIEAFNAAQRKAKNEVLELVGVVERKDQMDQLNEKLFRNMSKYRQSLLAEENDRGELLEYAALSTSLFCHLWPSAFRQRIQIGYYGTTRSMLEILSSEWKGMWRDGTRWSLATRFPAFGEPLSYVMLRLPAILAAEQVTGRLQQWILENRQSFSRHIRDGLFQGVAALFEILLLGTDILMLPIEYYAAAQRLGLAPALPLFPPLSSVLPWSPQSFHSYGWKPLLNVPILRSFTSPAAMLLLHRTICKDTDDTSVPILSIATDFRYPVINEDPSKVIAPRLSKDPVGWLLFKCYKLRTSFLHHSGWPVIRRDEIRRTRENDFENNTLATHTSAHNPPIYRSTTLAHLPAEFLSQAIDTFFARLITLPFESLMLRCIAFSYLSIPSTLKTPQGLLAAQILYTPFFGGPLTQVLQAPTSGSAWMGLAQYASRLGLSLALTASIDTILFFGIYHSTQEIGRKWYRWGEGTRLDQPSTQRRT